MITELNHSEMYPSVEPSELYKTYFAEEPSKQIENYFAEGNVGPDTIQIEEIANIFNKAKGENSIFTMEVVTNNIPKETILEVFNSKNNNIEQNKAMYEKHGEKDIFTWLICYRRNSEHCKDVKESIEYMTESKFWEETLLDCYSLSPITELPN